MEGVEAGSLLERSAQQAQLQSLLRRVEQSSGGLAAIDGAPGLGKSAMLQWTDDEASRRGFQTLRARCGPSEQQTSFGLVLQLFERPAAAPDGEELLRGSAALAAPLLRGQTSSRQPTSQADQDGLLHGLFWLTMNLSARGPLLLLADDLHWADAASLRFLLYLAMRLDDLPVGIVVTQRPGEPSALPLLGELAGHPRAACVSLAPLSIESVGQLLAAGLDQPVEDEFAAATWQATGGNPFLIGAIVRALRDDQIAPTADNARRLESLRPEAVRQQLLVRISRLGHNARAFASAVAVLGDGALLARVAALAELESDAAARAGDALVEAGILATSAPAAFAHPLTRAVLYEQLPGAQRGRSHARAAALLAAEHAGSEAIAAQLLPAARIGESWAIEVLRTAASRAMSAGNPEAAVRYLTRATLETPDSSERAEILLALAEAEARTGEPAAEGHVGHALELISEPRARARGLQALGNIQYLRGDRRAAADSFERALALLPDGADDSLARDLHAGYFSVASLDPELAEKAQAHVAPLLQRTPGGESPVERGALAAIAAFLSTSGAPREQAIGLAMRAWGEGALLAEEGPDGWAWTLVTGALSWTDRFAESVAISHAVMDAARQRGSMAAFATANFTGQATFWGRSLNDARAYGEAVQHARGYGWSAFVGASTSLHARVLIEQDELAAAEEVLASLDELEPTADKASWLAARGHLLLTLGRASEALTVLLEAGEILNRLQFVNPTPGPWRTDAALAAHQLGDHDRAAELLGEAKRIASGTNTPSHRAAALRTEARLSDPEPAIGLLEEALAAVDGTGARLEQLYCQSETGRTWRRLGQRSRATAMLGDALELARQLAAHRLARQLHEELKVLGARPQRLSFSGVDALTASERRVASLAAEGMPNREIAETLFVTPRTVEQHLYNTYKKLGINSRAKLASALDGADAD